MGWFGWGKAKNGADVGKGEDENVFGSANESGDDDVGWSDRLQDTIATKLNEAVDVPILSERQEQSLAERLVDFDRLKPSSWSLRGDNEGNSSNTFSWLDEYISINPELKKRMLEELDSVTATQYSVLIACTTASFALGFKMGRAQMPWTRFTNVTDIPSTYFGPTAQFLRGRVVSVSDGDTIRFLSAPTIFHSSRVGKDEKMSEVALPIRICTIDTPETAKFGKPSQPFGDDAKAKLSGMIDDRIVNIRLLQKDQYGRAVAEVRSGFFPFYKYMDGQMLKAGLAEVYLGGGAVYGFRGKDSYLEMQKKAKESKKGMWSLKDRETAAEFKARMKAEKS